MTKLTMKDKFELALVARGENIIKELSLCTVFSYRKLGTPTTHYIYAGRAGSLRWGQTRAKSIPFAEAFKLQLLAEADKILAHYNLEGKKS